MNQKETIISLIEPRVACIVRGLSLTEMTISEVMDKQSSRDIFAVGKFQLIPSTLKESVSKLGLNTNAKFSEVMQDYIFSAHLINGKRPQISNYLNQGGSLSNASVQEANTGLIETYTNLEQSINLNNPVIEGNITRFHHDASKYDSYWYHSDHLGNSSYISNSSGIISQHMEYLPFGETLVDEHQNSYNTPYKFNAKERDQETGNYYYGARYYNPKWSIWLSVDSLVEQTMDSYGYVWNNPLRYVDPDGRSGQDWVLGKDGKYTWDANVTSATDPDLNGREYVGKSINDVSEHYVENNPVKNFFGGNPKFGDTSTWPGEITAHENTMADDWAEGNIAQRAVYETVNSFSIVGQSLNPFDNQVTDLRGSDVGHMDNSEHGAMVAASLLPMPKGLQAVGKVNVPVYRTFGGVSRAQGYSWSLINPRLYGSTYRNFAGLPSGNTANFMIKGNVQLKNIINFRAAKPLDGNFGRLVPEIIANPNNVQLNSFRVLKN